MSPLLKKAKFKAWKPFEDIEIMDIEGFDTSLDNEEFRKEFVARFNDRIKYIASRDTEKGGMDKLPADALKSLEAVIEKLK